MGIFNRKFNRKFFETLFLKNREALMTIEPPAVNFTYANPSAVEMFGAKNEEEFLNYKQSDLAPERQPDGSLSEEKGMEMIKNAMKNGSCLFEWLHKRVNGEEFFADVFLSRIDRAGKPILFVSIRDITERKKMEKKFIDRDKEVDDQKLAILNILEDVEKEKNNAEILSNDLEKFKLAVDNASDQVVITDPEGVVIYGNRAVENITGYKPEEAIGKKAGTLWKSPMPQEYYQNMWHTIKEKKEAFVGEINNKRKNGELYVANISISPVLNDKNEVIYFVAIEHDITKEKEIDKAKTEFVSLASHQLRTPLSAINWYTEMLLDGDAGDVNEEQKKYLIEVSNGNKRMVDLVDALLNVSRIDLGTFTIEPEIVDIASISKSVLAELKPLIIEKNIKIGEFYDENVKDFKADNKLLRIILQNILSNAVKYTLKDGWVKIRIDVCYRGSNIGDKEIKEDGVLISVFDSGIGIPVGQKEKIFNKLFRADNARESETEGTGLGLYIVKSIVDQSGGNIWFISEENSGSQFYVFFPMGGMRKKDGEKRLD